MDRLAEVTATVIGVGAIGRQVALQLASIGTQTIQLIDFDSVDCPTRQPKVTESTKSVGQNRFATSQAISEIDPTIEVIRVEDRFRPRQEIGNAVFCCVDSITARTAIWRSVKSRAWILGRWPNARRSAANPCRHRQRVRSSLRFNTLRRNRGPARNLHITQHGLRRQHRSGNHGPPVHTLAPRHPNRRRHQRQFAVRRMDRPRRFLTKRTGHELSPRHPAPTRIRKEVKWKD